MAWAQKRWALVHTILAHVSQKPDLENWKFYQLFRQILIGDCQGAMALLQGVVDVDFNGMLEVTPLRVAVKQGNIQLAKLLLSKGDTLDSLYFAGCCLSGLSGGNYC